MQTTDVSDCWPACFSEMRSPQVADVTWLWSLSLLAVCVTCLVLVLCWNLMGQMVTLNNKNIVIITMFYNNIWDYLHSSIHLDLTPTFTQIQQGCLQKYYLFARQIPPLYKPQKLLKHEKFNPIQSDEYCRSCVGWSMVFFTSKEIYIRSEIQNVQMMILLVFDLSYLILFNFQVPGRR